MSGPWGTPAHCHTNSLGHSSGTGHDGLHLGASPPQLAARNEAVRKRVPFIGHSKEARYLRMATVRASGELAQGQMTSGLRPLDWKTLRKASQEEMDPV